MDSQAQGLSNLWLMGYYSGSGAGYGGTNINFYSGTADTSYQFRGMNFSQTNCSISNAQGNLLFYTNGIFIANTNNDTMLNGDNLNPSSFTTTSSQHGLGIDQSDLIIPFPADSTKYYLFHETAYYLSSLSTYVSYELYYSIIDMSLDGGLGEVIQKNVPIIIDTLNTGCVTGCKHANGRDWWIICHTAQYDKYYTLLITPYGIQGPFIQDIGCKLAYPFFIWQTCFSPDGTKLASFTPNDTLDIMDFDRCSGQLSNPISICINDSGRSRGIAFSPDSRMLYASSMYYVYQFDVTAANIASTQTTVAIYDGFVDPVPPFETSFYLAQLANDGKIYINSGNGSHYLHVINYPDSLGLACNLTQHSLVLPTYNSSSLPNFPNYFLRADASSIICDSLSVNITHLEKSYEEINIFPNPTHSTLTITCHGGNEITFVLNNMLGQTLCERKEKNLNGSIKRTIDLSSLPKGLYLLEITIDGIRTFRKVVKD